ncbi:helix-turn-helix domain-containing protein [Ruminiclostridium cellobioparum]|uniref:helix-turn-helix domain-containing protein n=1 Tax=Ruminiclostridium cellobioparum TaxID=29355 RepID=UPI0028AEEE93|nr:helix-turn-helix transcriptional regulator [Ruminiclostridium cellobioparum]
MELKDFDRLGSILKAARKTKGLTREQLAETLKITPRYLMSIENENKKPSYDVLFRLIRELGISADTIFYPERESTSSEIEMINRRLYLCDERRLKVIGATVTAILDNLE